jgi:hypothetical protein
MVIMAIMAHQGNNRKTGGQDSPAAGFSSWEGQKYGVGLLKMAFWHGLSGTIGLQCSTAFTKGDARCIEGCKEYSNDSIEPTFAWTMHDQPLQSCNPL